MLHQKLRSPHRRPRPNASLRASQSISSPAKRKTGAQRSPNASEWIGKARSPDVTAWSESLTESIVVAKHDREGGAARKQLAHRHCRHPNLVWTAPPLCPDMIFGKDKGSASPAYRAFVPPPPSPPPSRHDCWSIARSSDGAKLIRALWACSFRGVPSIIGADDPASK